MGGEGVTLLDSDHYDGIVDLGNGLQDQGVLDIVIVDIIIKIIAIIVVVDIVVVYWTWYIVMQIEEETVTVHCEW